jgi:hypothetical protein
METLPHRIVGAAAALTVAHYPQVGGWHAGPVQVPVVHLPHLTPAGVLASVIWAAIASGGPMSPDIDNQPWWKHLDRVLPDEWLTHGGPLGHRRLMHWWGLPAAVVVVWHLAAPTVPPLTLAAAWGAWIGWVSHLLPADCMFGEHNRYDHRGPGVPLAPWWGHVGLDLAADGPTARLFTYAAAGWGALAAATLIPALANYWPA